VARKETGLTPQRLVNDMVEVARGKKVRKVRDSAAEQKKSVLSEVCSGGTEASGGGRLFKPADGDNAERNRSATEAEVSDGAGTSDSFTAHLSRVLKRMLGEMPPQALLNTSDIKTVTTNAEALAAVIQREAFAGKQWACEFWRDMTEGKPVRAAQVNNTDAEVEAELDRVSLAALNRLAEKKGEA
jgi:hypothetical protein